MKAELVDGNEDRELRDTAVSLRVSFIYLASIYLASTRDYNTGRYAHDGLSFRFTESVAERVLAEAHREVFVSLAFTPLKILVTQLEQYIRSGCARPDELLATWHELEPFRILAPEHDDPITVKLFVSNIRVALAIVKESWRENQLQ